MNPVNVSRRVTVKAWGGFTMLKKHGYLHLVQFSILLIGCFWLLSYLGSNLMTDINDKNESLSIRKVSNENEDNLINYDEFKNKPLTKVEIYLQKRKYKIKKSCGDVCKTDEDQPINGMNSV